ncbi:MAG: hypothetical protein ACI8T1_002525 [Verrucomicrobiales bacterium]|jgi:hypothetical protein
MLCEIPRSLQGGHPTRGRRRLLGGSRRGRSPVWLNSVHTDNAKTKGIENAREKLRDARNCNKAILEIRKPFEGY